MANIVHLGDAYLAMKNRAVQLEAENARLRKAAEPFLTPQAETAGENLAATFAYWFTPDYRRLRDNLAAALAGKVET